jgi:hypothetical protein
VDMGRVLQSFSFDLFQCVNASEVHWFFFFCFCFCPLPLRCSSDHGSGFLLRLLPFDVMDCDPSSQFALET